MAGILSFEKPEKLRPTEEHNEMFSSDSGIPGTYVSNMSEEDELKWKAKHIKGSDERIEIRKTLECGTNIVIKVHKRCLTQDEYDTAPYSKKHKDIVMSVNGKMDMTNTEYLQMLSAIYEAQEILEIKI